MTDSTKETTIEERARSLLALKTEVEQHKRCGALYHINRLVTQCHTEAPALAQAVLDLSAENRRLQAALEAGERDAAAGANPRLFADAGVASCRRIRDTLQVALREGE